jgi:hypothetical protein
MLTDLSELFGVDCKLSDFLLSGIVKIGFYLCIKTTNLRFILLDRKILFPDLSDQADLEGI